MVARKRPEPAVAGADGRPRWSAVLKRLVRLLESHSVSTDDGTTIRPGPRAVGGPWNLRGVLGSAAGQSFALVSGTHLIGKIDEAEIRLTDSGVSRNHAEIAIDAQGRASIVDLGSTNGTFVSGQRIDEHPLQHGDVIGVGPDAVLLFAHGSMPEVAVEKLRVLSARETEVARLVAMGKTNNEIAAQLEISRRTVERHLANSFRRLGLRSRVELARFMLRGDV